MSIADTLHRAHKARLARIAARAMPEETATLPPLPPPPRYVLDDDYERAWAATILGSGGDRGRAEPRIEDIQRATARHFGLRPEDLLARESAIALARPRHVAMYLARALTTRSAAEIGAAFAGRDHSSVLHAVKRVRELLAGGTELQRAVDSIRAELTEILMEDMS